MHLGASTLGQPRSNKPQTWQDGAPCSLPAVQTFVMPSTMQRSQAWGHVCSPFLSGDADRNLSLDSSNNENLGNLSLGDNRYRQALRWVSPSLSDQGGDPSSCSLGSKPPLLEHLALGEGMATELELQSTSYMMNSLNAEGPLVLLVDSCNQESLKSFELGKERACKDKPRTKGAKQEDPNIACSVTAYKQTQQTRAEQKAA